MGSNEMLWWIWWKSMRKCLMLAGGLTLQERTAYMGNLRGNYSDKIPQINKVWMQIHPAFGKEMAVGFWSMQRLSGFGYDELSSLTHYSHPQTITDHYHRRKTVSIHCILSTNSDRVGGPKRIVLLCWKHFLGGCIRFILVPETRLHLHFI